MRLSNKCLSVKSRVLLEKFVLSELIKKVPAFLGFQGLIPEAVRILRKSSPHPVPIRLKHLALPSCLLPALPRVFWCYIITKYYPGIEARSMSWTRRGSTSCVPLSKNSISCVRRYILHVYQLRPKFSAPNMTSCVPRLVRNCISCIERYGYTKCPTVGRLLHSFIVLYTQLYAHIQNCWMISATQLLYYVTVFCLSPI